MRQSPVIACPAPDHPPGRRGALQGWRCAPPTPANPWTPPSGFRQPYPSRACPSDRNRYLARSADGSLDPGFSSKLSMSQKTRKQSLARDTPALSFLGPYSTKKVPEAFNRMQVREKTTRAVSAAHAGKSPQIPFISIMLTHIIKLHTGRGTR